MSKPIWPEEVNEAVEKLGSNWLKPSSFEGKGLVLQVKRVEKITSRNPKYGAVATDYLVKNEVLEIGDTFHYVFGTPEGHEKQLDSKSTPFFIGMKQSECEANDWVRIVREGERDETRYTITKVDTPVKEEAKDTHDDSKDLPF